VTIGNPTENTSLANAIEAFIDAASERGLILSPQNIVADGEIHRCRVEGRSTPDGVYVLHLDGIPAGWFLNWADGEDGETWVYRDGERLSPEELEEHQRVRAAREQEMAARRERAAQAAKDEARRIWDAAAPATEHDYLTEKRIAPYDLRVSGGDLIIPMRAVHGELHYVQRIKPDGRKEFQTGSQTKGLCWRLGPEPTKDETVVIAEGAATGASIHAITNRVVLVAFNRGNLKPVAEAVHQKWPKADIVIAIDDDRTTEADKGTNPGFKDGLAAARAVKGKAVVPDFTGITRDDRWNDFNDLAVHCGEEAVTRSFEGVMKPDDLFAKVVLTDPHSIFRPWRKEEYQRLNPEAKSRLRAELKKTKAVRLTDLDGEPEAADEDDKEQEKDTARQVDRLVSIAKSKGEFFHTPKQVPFADIRIKGIRETHPVRGKAFRRWLGYEYRQETGTVASSEALSNAIGALEAEAHYDGEERKIFIRIGGHEGKIYIDLGDPTWRAIEVDTEGWRIVSELPVRFRRSDGAGVLPEPVRGGSVRDLRPFLNVASEAAFVIVVAWLVGALRDRGPYLILAVYGPGGSAKTCFAKILRALVDPRLPETEGFPNDRETLILNASFAHVLAFDNISVIRPEMSDDLAKLATGTGLTRRTKFADEDQTIFDACLPLILNGIETFVIRGDLVSRAATLTLEEIQDSQRRTEEALFAEFEAKRPGILGALLDAVVNGLRQMPHMSEGGHRMADAYKWIAACETGAPWAKHGDGKAIAFKEALAADNEETALAVLATNRLAIEIRTFAKTLPESGKWEETIGEFYTALNNQFAEEKDRKALERDKKWPADVTRFSGALRRIIPHLPYWGISVTIGEHTNKGRKVCVRKVPLKARNLASSASPASQSNEIKDLAEASQSQPSVNAASPEPRAGFEAADTGDAGLILRDSKPPPANPLKTKESDASDASDADLAINRGGTAGYTHTDDDPDGSPPDAPGGVPVPPPPAEDDPAAQDAVGDSADEAENQRGAQTAAADGASPPIAPELPLAPPTWTRVSELPDLRRVGLLSRDG
jgi:phage/plasmid primase-like uncharacterized protein